MTIVVVTDVDVVDVDDDDVEDVEVVKEAEIEPMPLAVAIVFCDSKLVDRTMLLLIVQPVKENALFGGIAYIG
jgi:hypothetical protein